MRCTLNSLLSENLPISRCAAPAICFINGSYFNLKYSTQEYCLKDIVIKTSEVHCKVIFEDERVDRISKVHQIGIFAEIVYDRISYGHHAETFTDKCGNRTSKVHQIGIFVEIVYDRISYEHRAETFTDECIVEN